jgi:hypothetical protein
VPTVETVSVANVKSRLSFFRPPPDSRYTTLISFGDETPEWSIVVEPTSEPEHYSVYADCRFLSPMAPNEKLKSGVTFRLWEGSNWVAFGELI